MPDSHETEVAPFRFGYASEGDAALLARRCIEQAGPLPDGATLGFVYATDRLGSELPIILETLRQLVPGVEWIGSVGMGIVAGVREYYDERALAVMVTDLQAQHFRLIPNSTDLVPTVPPTLAKWCREEGACFALLHAEPTYVATSAFIGHLGETVPDCFVNGGLSSAEGSSYQIANGVFDDGISGVLLSSAVEVLTDHTQGCSPIGPVHRVGQAEQNLVLTLDGRPALEVLKEDVGEVLARDWRKLGGYIFVGLPIEGSDTGDYQVRNLMGLDLEQQLIAVGDYMEQRERLMFCRRDGNTAREDMQCMLERLKKRLAGRPIRGGIYISCIGRGRNQFGDDSAELKLIAETLGEFPLVGFFANGELYNSRLYGYTGVLTLFV